jgi:hypothetical protein
MGRSKNSKIKQKNTAPPQTELECRRLQEEYIKPDCSQLIKDEYFFLLRNYAKSLSLKEIKRKGIYLPPERVSEICTDATLLLLSQYSKPGWKIRASFAGALYWKLLEAMYGQANEDMAFSLNTTFNDDNDSKEVIDLVDSNAQLPWYSKFNRGAENTRPQDILLEEIDTSIDEINGIIEEAYEMLPYVTYLKFLPWLVLKIRKPRARNIQKLYSKIYLTNKEENAFDILLLEIRNRIIKHA